MANTVSSLSYANTFGDWVVATDNLITENNILAKENYVKDSGTLYLSENSQTALQSNGNVVIQKTLSVVGIGSSATIQNNLDVQGQGYFSNGNLSLATTGTANIGNVLYVLGSDTALRVANNSRFGGNISVVNGTYTNTLQANNSVNTSNASIYNTVYTNRIQSNTSILTDTLSANTKVYTNEIQSNTSILTSTIHANTHVTTTSVGVTGTAWVNVLQANTSTNTSNASVIHTLYANVVQANISTNTVTASVTGTTFTDILQANSSANTRTMSVTGTTFTDRLQANSSSNTANASVVWTLYANVVQANVSTNTATASVTGTTFTDVLQANTSANTTTLSVTGTSFTDVLQANTSANTTTLSVVGTTFTDVLQANTSANTRTLSVTGTAFADVVQANSSANTRTMSVTGTTFTDTLQANTSANTTTLSVVGITFTNALQANTSANTRTLSVTGTSFTDVLQANSSVNTANVWATTTVTANTIRANNDVYSQNVRVSGLIAADTAEARVYNLQVGDGGLSITGNFTLNGRTVFNSNEFIISQGTPNQTSKFSIFRTANGAANGVASNASIRWNETGNYFDLNDVSTGTYYRIITEQQISDSITTVDGARAASLTAANVLNNNIITANNWLRSRSDSASLYANGAFGAANSASSYANGAFGAANSASSYANSAFAAANNVGPQIAPAFGQANAAFAKANAATAEIKGTTGSISPTNASLTFTSNNGVQIYATGANTLAFSTAQDIRTTATPSFASLTLSTTPLAASSGGTGSTSLSSSFQNMITAATGGTGTAGYVLATGGAGNYYWTSAPTGGGGGVTPGTRITSNRLSYTGDGVTTLYDTPSFSQANQVRVYINGVRQAESEYSLNSGTSKITFNTAPVNGDKFFVEVDGFTTYEYYANNIAYGPVTGLIPSSANTIQLAIDDLESRKMPKSGGTFTGDVIGITMATSTSNTSFATTQFVNNLANSNYTFAHSITGNAGTVTNGLYSTGSYANPAWITSLNADKLSGGTISSTILGNSTHYIGTTAIALNRASASQTLTGVSIDGDAATVGTLSVNTANTNDTANRLVRTDASGNTIVKTLISSTHEKLQASPVYVMASNSTGTSANVTSYQTAYLSVAYATTAGSAPASDVYAWAKAATKPTYTKSEVGLGNVDNTADANKSVSYAATAGRAYPRRSDGGDLNFYWSGQSGQPTWLWGGTDGTNMYVYNPSNFSVNYATSAGTFSSTTQNSQFNSIGIGTAATGITGEIRATNNITAYYSDDRLKTKLGNIENALDKIDQLTGFYYEENELAESLGYKKRRQIGVSAQQVQKQLPDCEVVVPAPIDENYLTVRYEKLIPLLIEGIKELRAELETLKGQIK